MIAPGSKGRPLPGSAELRAAGIPDDGQVWRREGDLYVRADRITAEAAS